MKGGKKTTPNYECMTKHDAAKHSKDTAAT